MSGDQPDLGNVGMDEIAQTALANDGVGIDSGLPPTTRFLSACFTVIRARLASGDTAADSPFPALFILGQVEDEALELSSDYRYLYAGATSITGRVWVGNVALTNARFAPVELAPEEIDEFVESIGAIDAPVLIYFPGSSTENVHFFPEGIDRAESMRPLRIDQTPTVSSAAVEQFISDMHEEHFVTPLAQSPGFPLWKNAAIFSARSDAEHKIQGQLRVGFGERFPGVKAIPEEVSSAGRADLTLATIYPGGLRQTFGTLELKVLRTRGEGSSTYSAQATSKWIDDGIDQAHAYAIKNKAPWKTLCCFDMRRVPTRDVLDTHVARATTLGVGLAHWPIFNEAKPYQRQLADQAIEVASRDAEYD